MSKVYADAAAALHDVFEGASIMSGGFGLCGNAENCIAELARRGDRDLTVISNNCGNAGRMLAKLLQKRQVSRVVASFIGGNPDLQQQMLAGEVTVELNPQGTLAERIRAGGAGLGGFYTPTGVGTEVAEGKEERVIDGKRYLLETPLTVGGGFTPPAPTGGLHLQARGWLPSAENFGADVRFRTVRWSVRLVEAVGDFLFAVHSRLWNETEIPRLTLLPHHIALLVSRFEFCLRGRALATRDGSEV